MALAEHCKATLTAEIGPKVHAVRHQDIVETATLTAKVDANPDVMATAFQSSSQSTKILVNGKANCMWNSD